MQCRRWPVYVTLLLCGLGRIALATDDDPPELISVERIWDQGKHNAFTDLIRFQNQWFCCFREADAHVGGDGQLRVLRSTDGQAWTSAALVPERGIDLRDPKLSITPDGKLMMVAGGSVYGGTTNLQGRRPRVCFSSDGSRWSAPERVLADGDWLWRVTWHKGRAYGFTYYLFPNVPDTERTLRLVTSSDGRNWSDVAVMDTPGKPNECTVRFLDDDTAIAFLRREGGNQNAWIGTSQPPYDEWSWTETDQRIGGPNFIVLPDGSMWGGGRSYKPSARTKMGRLTTKEYIPLLELPSSGDNSYPGFVWHDNLLWMSYYSSHEGKTSIYLARIRLPR